MSALNSDVSEGIAPPDPTRLRDPKHWRERAEEARVKGEMMHDKMAISTMVKVAEQYEALARQAEKSASLEPA